MICIRVEEEQGSKGDEARMVVKVGIVSSIS